jgi:hypothetical protein
MTIGRRFLPILILGSLVAAAQAVRAEDAGSWDGSWHGTLGKTNPWPIAISIENGKVVSFTEKGARFDVQFTKVTPTTVLFGDPQHYTMRLIKTGDTTAAAKIRGRHGAGAGTLTKS